MTREKEAFEAQVQEDPVLAFRLLQLRLMMLERGLSRSLVARTMGVSPSYLSRVLHGKTVVSLSFLDRMDDTIHCLSHGWSTEFLDSGLE